MPKNIVERLESLELGKGLEHKGYYLELVDYSEVYIPSWGYHLVYSYSRYDPRPKEFEKAAQQGKAKESGLRYITYDDPEDDDVLAIGFNNQIKYVKKERMSSGGELKITRQNPDGYVSTFVFLVEF